MSLSEKDVLKIAKLSRIRIKDDEVAYYQKELSSILDWVDMLQEVNTDDVQQMSSVVSETLPLREDQVMGGYKQDDILANAPKADYGCFIVPKVVE